MKRLLWFIVLSLMSILILFAQKDEEMIHTYGTDLVTLLIGRVQEQYPLLSANSFKIFFLPEQEDHASGFSYQYYSQRLQLCFSSGTPETTIHELLHGMGLPHTFDGFSPNTKYTYEDGKTDNIMDYSHLIGVKYKASFTGNGKPLIISSDIFH